MQLEGHRVRRLTEADAPAVQALFALNPAYFEAIESAPLRPDEGLQEILHRPPGVPPERKHNFLIDDTALLSLLEGFPDPGTWYLGLLFIAPAARGAGLGTRALEALCAHAREHGGTALRLAVVPANTGARRLYDRLGFAFVARRPRTGWNDVVIDVDVLERTL